MRKTFRFFLEFFLIALTVGCAEPIIRTDGSPSVGVDLSRYRRIAIVDFQMLGGSDRASFVMHDALFKELKKRKYEVLGRIETNRKIKEKGIPTEFSTLSMNAQRIGSLLGVDAIFGGTVSSVPLSDEEIFFNVTTSIIMVDTATGFTVWFGSGDCQDGTLKGCMKRIARGALKNFPKARRKK
jgi:hypothetical protein